MNNTDGVRRGAYASDIRDIKRILDGIKNVRAVLFGDHRVTIPTLAERLPAEMKRKN
ncbi:MAG: hypothetical protein J5940_06070 [Clostridia bacterium]|nr:hypothetical protein [Clostridia bacterium]